MSLPDGLAAYLVARDEERTQQAAAMLANLTERERRLVREAAVMGFVHGTMAGHLTREQFPKDSRVVQEVLLATVSMRDLYPTLASLDDHQDVDDDHDHDDDHDDDDGDEDDE